MPKKKLMRDKAHNKHRWNVRKWRSKHPGQVYRKVDGKYKWIPKKK